MQQYLDLLSHVMENGVDRGDRTGTGTRGVFGYQMRFDLADGFPMVTTKSWEGPLNEDGSVAVIDQVDKVIEAIKTNPYSRRHIVSAWNPADVDDMALPPCHCLFQFHVADGKLSCQLYQRSADIFLGVPFNIASYALLTHMMAQVCGLEVGSFVHTFGDAHIYSNHFEQVKEQLRRDPMPLPKLKLNPNVKSVYDFKYADVKILRYEAHPHIAGKVAV